MVDGEPIGKGAFSADNLMVVAQMGNGKQVVLASGAGRSR